ncbi:MAG: CZB domain-containing protein [Magnetococcales bacterium]|nr:CZB domain-containing protein [Magnetococcales bacterium]
MQRIDLGIARMAHLVWETELEEMALKKRPAVHLQTHEECELGLWLNGEAFQSMQHYGSVRQLIAAHQQFHQTAFQLLFQLDHGSPELVSRELQRVQTLSRDIVFHITEVELDYLEHKPLSQFASHPFKSLIYRLFHVAEETAPENHGILEVSHARLMHLRWSRELLRAFHHWGREADLGSDRTCAVGIWIHGVGLATGQYPEMIQELDRIHQQFHAKAEETVRLLRRKNIPGSENAYKEVVSLGREVLYLLTKIEVAFLKSENVTSPINLWN